MRWRRLAVLGTAATALLFFLAVGAMYVFASIPEPSEIARAQSVTVVDHRGEPLGRLHAEADRISIPLSEMPQSLRDAVIATEDRRFYEHRGVRITSIVRAALANAAGRGIKQGGSTITQQYVKNAFVGSERSLWRKMKEGVLSVKLERQRSKNEILALYLNTIYFGRGAYGSEAAALAYFGKKTEALTLPESAMLAGLIKSPESYDPVREPEAATGRRNQVLDLMVRDGYLSEEEAAEAKATKLRARRRASGGTAPHYLEELRRRLELSIGPSRLYSGGIKVHATLDARAQTAAEEAVAAVFDRPDDPEASIVAIDPKSGGVRAMVGARDFGRLQFNLALARRQPGSTFKPVVLAAAFGEGVSPNDRFPAPGKATYRTDSGPWEVSTYDGKGYGTLDLARATELSVNTVYADLILDVGAEKAADVARSLGARSRIVAVPSLALGTSEVSPLELASMYATLAARGTYREPYMIEKVTDAKGRTLQLSEPETAPGIDRDVADTVNHVLQGVIRSGTGRAADPGRPAAGKTGTTSDYRDAWFAGYTPELAAVVWNGYPAKGRLMTDVRGRRVSGGSFPAEMWRRFMRAALQGTPATAFAPPPETEDARDATPSPGSSPSASPTLPTPVPSLPVTPSPSPSASPSPSPSRSPSPSPTRPAPSPTPSPSPSA